MGILKFNQYFSLGLCSFFLLDLWSALSIWKLVFFFSSGKIIHFLSMLLLLELLFEAFWVFSSCQLSSHFKFSVFSHLYLLDHQCELCPFYHSFHLLYFYIGYRKVQTLLLSHLPFFFFFCDNSLLLLNRCSLLAGLSEDTN